MNFLVWLTGRMFQGQPDPDQSSKFMFINYVPFSLLFLVREFRKIANLASSGELFGLQCIPFLAAVAGSSNKFHEGRAHRTLRKGF